MILSYLYNLSDLLLYIVILFVNVTIDSSLSTPKYNKIFRYKITLFMNEIIIYIH